jgi:hypothetical protein
MWVLIATRGVVDMMILTRKHLNEAAQAAFGGVALVAAAVWLRPEIERYIGFNIPGWVFVSAAFFCALALLNALIGWVDILRWERNERRCKEEEERENAKDEAERERERAKYAAFLSWVRQNPRTADRLMAIVEHEQVEDSDYRTWLIERRDKEGPNPLTDLPRLYDWLQARRDLHQYGIEVPLFLS